MTIAVVLLLILHCWMFYLRHIKFYAQPKEVSPLGEDEIMYPVEGHLMYAKLCEFEGWMVKRGRYIPLPTLTLQQYYQIGVYMSPMCNHHVFAPTNSKVVKTYYEGDELLPMLDSWDMLWPLAWARDWLVRKSGGFITKNRRLIYHFENGIVMAVIFDKYVAQYTNINRDMNGRRLLGFIGRGSQVDLFIPKGMISITYHDLFPDAEKVNYNTLVTRTKKRNNIPWRKT